MDSIAPWRAVETEVGSEGTEEAGGFKLSSRHLLLGFAAAVAAVSLGVMVVMEMPRGGQVQVVQAGSSEPSQDEPSLVVDVAGAVARPGVYRLPAGSRVGDAIAAAGGYSKDVDTRRAEAQLNLAARVQDGEQIWVPRRGEASQAVSSPGPAAAGSPGPVNLNTASEAELDSLPGIGPVTAQKIIAARQQQPFGSVQDLLTRKLVSAGTFAKLRDLVTV